MPVQPLSLVDDLAEIRSGRADLLDVVHAACDRIDRMDGDVQAMLPEVDRRDRLAISAHTLLRRFPDASARPPLFGALVAVKDIFHVDGFATRAGTEVPARLFAGAEAPAVTALRASGALIVGKTVTTEMAFFEPGPTRNPHALEHTPGGSSQGSAAAVACGYCHASLGSQTIGSVIRPAAFCGVAGFKPTYGRVSLDGVLPFSPAADHVGFFTGDAAALVWVAALTCSAWHSVASDAGFTPVLGIPRGPYLAQADAAALDVFEAAVASLSAAGYTVLDVPALANIADINERHRALIAAEFAQTHERMYAMHEALYRPRTADLIREGRDVAPSTLVDARNGRAELRAALDDLMSEHGVDLWLSPSASGPAPKGLASTGDPAMNLPWTHAGLPTLSVPAGTIDALPLGLQCAGRWMDDERVLRWAPGIERAVREAGARGA